MKSNNRRNGSAKASKNYVNLSGLRITICCEPDVNLNNWVRALQRERAEINCIWPPPAGRLSADMDILVCEYFPEIANLIPWVPGESRAALIILLPQNGRFDDGIVVSNAPQSVLQRPLTDELLATSVKVAWSQYRYEKRLLDRVNKLDENVRVLRDVERAKMIIMSEKNIDLDAAYRHLREKAMNSQTSVSSIATSIIESTQTRLGE